MSGLIDAVSVKVELVTVDEARAIIAALGHDPMKYGEGMFHGFVEGVCRDHLTGREAWRFGQPNVITDLGRRAFGVSGLGTSPVIYLFTSQSAEQPAVTRYYLGDEGGGAQVSAGITPTYASSTLAKSWFNTFPTPGANRTIATVGLAARNLSGGHTGAILAYTLLSPSKVQTTTQTLEVNYRILFTPVY